MKFPTELIECVELLMILLVPMTFLGVSFGYMDIKDVYNGVSGAAVTYILVHKFRDNAPNKEKKHEEMH